MKLVLTLLVAGTLGSAGDKTPPNALTVVDANGKEHTFQTWKFTAGTKHLSWLAPPGEDEKEKDKDKEPPKGKGKGKKEGAQVGPPALEFSEGKGAPLKKRVLSYIPLASIRSIDFDAKKEIVSVRVARSDKEDDDEVLYGRADYQEVNFMAVEATRDLGELGKAIVQFQSGAKEEIKSLRFSAPKPLEAPPAGRVAAIKQASKSQPGYAVTDLQALYLTPGGRWQISPTLYFKDTIKIDLAKIEKMVRIGTSGGNFDVSIKGGQQAPLVLIENPKGADDKTVLQLEGLIGRFAGGYRLFPMTTIGELQFEEKAK
jgi:hypothetical protein